MIANASQMLAEAFYVQTFVRIYLGDIEVDAFSYHDAAVKAERKVCRELVEDKGEEGKRTIGF